VPVTVGDVIIQARQLVPDLPGPPAPPVIYLGAITNVGTLAAGVYFAVATFFTVDGESLPSAEFTFTIPGGFSSIGLSVGGPGSTFALPTPLYPGTTAIRIYYTNAGGGTGNENQFVTFPYTFPGPGGGTLTGIGTAGTPPTTSPLQDPNQNGPYASARALFYWLSEGLTLGSRLAGGLPDMSGVQTLINAPSYTATGEWVDFTDCWYDGYPLSFSAPGSFFARNTVTSSILAAATLTALQERLIIDVWPQPARTPVTTTLANPILATDSTIVAFNAAGFLLPFGMLSLSDSLGNIELVRYGIMTGNTFSGCIRGLGGAAPQAWAAGVTLRELNLFWQGNRVFNTKYVPGQASMTLPVPAGWDSFLISFLLSKYYESEKDSSNAQAKRKEFEESIKSWAKTNRMTLGPLQAGSRDYQFVVFGGTRFGGNVIP
jgi:hypothetical protein